VRQHSFSQHKIDFSRQGLPGAGGEACKTKRLHIAGADAHRKQHLSISLDKSPANLESQGDLAALIDIRGDFQQASGERESMQPGRELAAIFEQQCSRHSSAQGYARRALERS